MTRGDVIWRAVGCIALPPIVIVASVLLYLLAAVLFGLIPLNSGYRPADGGVDVFVRSNGVHADLVVPLRAAGIDWRTRLPVAVLEPLDGVTDDLAFGWGDRGFYLSTPTWSDLRLATAVRALTGLDRTVLHVEALSVPQADESVRHVRVSADDYRKLATFIEASFARDGGGAPILVAGAHYGDHDAFFEANGHYSLFETCNEWTRRGLATAGVRVPVWAPFDKALFYQLPPE